MNDAQANPGVVAREAIQGSSRFGVLPSVRGETPLSRVREIEMDILAAKPSQLRRLAYAIRSIYELHYAGSSNGYTETRTELREAIEDVFTR